MAITDLALSFTPVAGGAFPDGYASRMAGGYHIAATTSARNAIPDYRRAEGMLCWVVASGGSLWRLKASPWAGTDGDWDAASTTGPAGATGASALFFRTAIADAAFTPADGYSYYALSVTQNTYLAVTLTGSAIWEIYLPLASTCSGREAIVENATGSGYALRIYTTNPDTMVPVVVASHLEIAPGNTVRLVSDGVSQWAVMENSTPVVPAPAGVEGAVIIESDAFGTRVVRHLYQQDIAPDFAISGFSLSPGALVRRGDVLATNTSSATYVSGPPTSGSIAESFANGASSGGGSWSISTPFASGSRTSTVSADGVDGSADPSWTVELTVGLAGFSDRVASATVFWASDVYYGSTVAADVANTDVYDSGPIGLFLSSLQRTRNQVRSFSGTDRYDWFLYPDQAAYTSGTPTFKDQSGFTFGTTYMGTVIITRNGVARTYRKIRSAGLLSSAFTVTVT